MVRITHEYIHDFLVWFDTENLVKHDFHEAFGKVLIKSKAT